MKGFQINPCQMYRPNIFNIEQNLLTMIILGATVMTNYFVILKQIYYIVLFFLFVLLIHT